jgi:hypothetical protein
MASLIRGGRRSTLWIMRAGLIENVLFVLAVAVILVLMLPGTVYSAVSVGKAELSGGNLWIQGTALPNRQITVDGVVMGVSGGDGRFQVARSGFIPPADCTVDVNDGWAAPVRARLTGCTVSRAQ